jgi:hypothetical protein
MHSKSLEPEQIQRLLATVQRYAHYFDRLEGRMHQKHFPLNDPVYVAARKAQYAVKQLSTELNQLLGS